MGRLIVFEEGKTRTPLKGDHYEVDRCILIASADYGPLSKAFPILRRLTDAEVDALVTAKPADDERGRFVRETAARLMASPIVDPANNRLVYQNIDDAIANAESLAARLWEKK